MPRCLISFLCLLIVLAGFVGIAEGGFIIVDDDWAPADHDNIQDAVDNATAGDIIYVYEGEYEGAVIDKELTLWGNGTDLVYISSPALVLNCSDNITIKRVSIVNSTNGLLGTGDSVSLRSVVFTGITDTSISVTGSESVLLKRVDIDGGFKGIVIDHSESIDINNCTLTGMGIQSLYLDNTTDAFIHNVTVDDSEDAVTVSYSSYITIYNVNLSDSQYGLLMENTDNTTLRKLNVTDCFYGVFLDASDTVDFINSNVELGLFGTSTTGGTYLTATRVAFTDTEHHHLNTVDSTVMLRECIFDNSSDNSHTLSFENTELTMVHSEIITSEKGARFEASYAVIENSTLDASNTDMTLVDSDVLVYNTTFTYAVADSDSFLQKLNYIHVYVSNTKGPIEGIHVRVLDEGETLYSTSGFGGSDPRTGPGGAVRWIWIPYLTWSGSTLNYNETYLSVMLGPWGDEVELNMSNSHWETFIRPYGVDIYVNETASDPMSGSEERPYDTIARAVTNSTHGDKIFIAPGSYDGADISMKLNLTGSNGAEVDWLSIDVDGVRLFDLAVNWLDCNAETELENITITQGGGLVIDEPTEGEGLFLDGSTAYINAHFEMEHVEARDAETGLIFNASASIEWINITNCDLGMMIASASVEIDHLIATDCGEAILFEGAAFSKVENSMTDSDVIVMFSSSIDLQDVDVNGTIWLNSSLSVTMTGCDVSDLMILGSALEEFDHDIDSSNTRLGNEILYLKDHDDDVDANGTGFVGLIDAADVEVSGLLGDARLLSAFSSGIDVIDADVATTMPIDAVSSDLTIARSTLNGSVALKGLDSDIEARDSVAIGDVDLSFSTLVGQQFGMMDIICFDSHVFLVNSTWDNNTLTGNSTIQLMNPLQVVVKNTDDFYLRDADIRVNSTPGSYYVTEFFNGTDVRTNLEGRSDWMFVPYSMINSTGVSSIWVDVHARYRASENISKVNQVKAGRVTLTIQNHMPGLSVQFPSNGSGVISFTIEVTDENEDPVDMILLYSLDGGTWSSGTLVSGSTGLNSSADGVQHETQWDSSADLSYLSGTVYLRFIPNDGFVDGTPANGSIELLNTGLNDPPWIKVNSTDEPVWGIVEIEVSVYDVEGNPVNLSVRYFDFEWRTASLIGSISTLASSQDGVEHTIEWNSTADIPDFVGPINLSVLPNDQYHIGETVYFQLNLTNHEDNLPPSATPIVPLDGSTVNTTKVSFFWSGSDPDGDDLEYRLWLSENGGAYDMVYEGSGKGRKVTGLDPGADYQWYVSAYDGFYTTHSNVYSFDVDTTYRDVTPPIIDHEQIDEADGGESLEITAVVNDERKVTAVLLDYGYGNTSYRIEMAEKILKGDPVYSGVIPKAHVQVGLWYLITASDGETNVTFPSSGVPNEIDVTFPPDTLKPLIWHVEVEDWTIADPIPIVADLGDDQTIKKATLFYRKSGYSEYLSKQMVLGNATISETYPYYNVQATATISSFFVASEGVDYYINVTDGTNIASYGTFRDPINVNVLDGERSVKKTVVFPNGHVRINATVIGHGDVVLRPTSNPSSERGRDIEIFFEILVEDLTLVMINISVEFGTAEEGIDPADLKLYYYDPILEKWIKIKDSVVVLRTSTVWGEVDHLTKFAPLVEKGPDDGDEGRPVNLLPLLVAGFIVILLILLVIAYMRYGTGMTAGRDRREEKMCPRCGSAVRDPAMSRCPDCGALLPKAPDDAGWTPVRQGGEEIPVAGSKGPREEPPKERRDDQPPRRSKAFEPKADGWLDAYQKPTVRSKPEPEPEPRVQDPVPPKTPPPEPVSPPVEDRAWRGSFKGEKKVCPRCNSKILMSDVSCPVCTLPLKADYSLEYEE